MDYGHYLFQIYRKAPAAARKKEPRSPTEPRVAAPSSEAVVELAAAVVDLSELVESLVVELLAVVEAGRVDFSSAGVEVGTDAVVLLDEARVDDARVEDALEDLEQVAVETATDATVPPGT